MYQLLGGSFPYSLSFIGRNLYVLFLRFLDLIRSLLNGHLGRLDYHHLLLGRKFLRLHCYRLVLKIGLHFLLNACPLVPDVHLVEVIFYLDLSRLLLLLLLYLLLLQ